MAATHTQHSQSDHRSSSITRGDEAQQVPEKGVFRSYQLLRLLNLYRLIIASACLALSAAELLTVVFPGADHALFYEVSLMYLLFSAAAIYPMLRGRPSQRLQLNLGVSLDIVAIILLMHAAGGIASGLGGLLMVSIVGAGIISDGRLVGLFAALATLAILSEQIYAQWQGLSGYVNYSLAGMWGIAFFAMASLSRVLSKRLRDTEALAHQRGVDLATMAELTDYVIQQMDTGVIVLDVDGTVRLMNRSVQRLLQVSPSSTPKPLKDYSPALGRALQQWQRATPVPRQRHIIANAQKPLLVQYRRIGSNDQSALLFIDDAASASDQAQQLKLAAWGRLTASMAHEVRNPLGAISHATDLLAESPSLDRADDRLIRIVQEHTRRINHLVESVMTLGNRDRSEPEAICLNDWLPGFVRSFLHMQPSARQALTLDLPTTSVHVWFDLDQLEQILINLCRNGLNHANPMAPCVRITCAALPGHQASIEVIDNGSGVSTADQPKLFKPFFTTQKEGTGLGLYLSRELALANQGDLFYRPMAESGGRFCLMMTADVSGPRHQQTSATGQGAEAVIRSASTELKEPKQ